MEKQYSANYAREELMAIEAGRFIKGTDTV